MRACVSGCGFRFLVSSCGFPVVGFWLCVCLLCVSLLHVCPCVFFGGVPGFGVFGFLRVCACLVILRFFLFVSLEGLLLLLLHLRTVCDGGVKESVRDRGGQLQCWLDV